jgi:endonuclease/exonuclease/phosphatase family metal-dependent hydrolase
LIAVFAGAVIADGSRITPADPTKPVVLRGDATPASPASNVLRVATFNIHGGRGADRRYDIARTAAVLSPPPDLIGLNEVRGTWNESLWPDQASQLGSLLGMPSAFVPTERRWWHDHFGNALLTRLPVRQIHRLPLPGTRGKAFRCATLAQFEFQRRPVQLLAVHVDSQSDREAQLRAVISLFLGLQPPAILTGDLNADRNDPRIRELLARPDVVDPLHDAPPDARGRQHIDWILARGFRSRSGRLIDNEASDHPAVVAELELTAPAE